MFGILIQRYFDLQGKKQEIEIVKLNHANSIQLAQIESERATARANADVAIAERRIDEAEVVGDYEGLKAAMEADRATYLDPQAQRRPGKVGATVTLLMGLVDAFRGFIRPGMTAYLCGLTTIMFFWVRDLAEVHKVSLSNTQVTDLMLQIVTSILYVFITCTLFWFGTRPPRSR